MPRELRTQILIAGASTGGTAAALAASSMGFNVILTEPTAWIGGQLTSQAVPPDENPWIETTGCTRSYREMRNRVRDWYRSNRALTDAAKADPHLNPGGGGVSKLCAEPKVFLQVLEEMLAPHVASKKLQILGRHLPIKADVEKDSVRSITLKSADNTQVTIAADYFLDATDLGDLLPLTKTEY